MRGQGHALRDGQKRQDDSLLLGSRHSVNHAEEHVERRGPERVSHEPRCK